MLEAIFVGAAGFLFLRELYHSGVLSGWIVQGLRQPKKPALPAPPPRDPRLDDLHEAILFLGSPLSWWLDPNRWGDDPNWRQRLKDAEPFCGCGEGMVHKRSDHDAAIAKRNAAIAAESARAPKCPVCGPKGRVMVLNVHGGEATMWDCDECGAEFTRSGETKSSRIKRFGEIMHWNQFNPPAMMQRRSRLPCGHYGGITEGRMPYSGWPFCVCDECGAEWEPPSQGSSREMAQGETLYRPSERLWELRVAKMSTGEAANHGACPTCDSPVDKHDGRYFCSRKECRRYVEGWK